MDIELVGRNIFAISLDLESDRERITSDGPWHFFKELMILQKADSSNTAMNTIFDQIPIWVQLHNMPIAFMEPQVIRRIGEQIGTVVEIDDNRGGSYVGRYARVKVRRSLKDPLIRCIPLKIEGTTEDGMILVLYEKLPDHICFACGRLGHYLRQCKEGDENKAKSKFGNWIKAGRGLDYRKNTYHHIPTPLEKRGPPGFPRHIPYGSRPTLRGFIEETNGHTENSDRESGDGQNPVSVKENETDIETTQMHTIKDLRPSNKATMEGENENLLLPPSVGTEISRVVSGDNMRIEMEPIGGTMEVEKRNFYSPKPGQKTLKKLNFISPAKAKLNPRGKGWKRMARIKTTAPDTGQSDEGSPKGLLTGQKRQGGDGSIGVRKKSKSTLMDGGLEAKSDTCDNPTAAAAEQSRRSP